MLRFLSFASALLFLGTVASAQGNETIQYRPEAARRLGRVVTYANNQPVQGATVEICDGTFKVVLASLRTDAAGRFFFPGAKWGKRYFIKAYLPGCDIAERTVRLIPRAKSQIHFILQPGT